MRQSISRPATALCTAILMFLAPAWSPVEARVANPDLIPTNCVYVLSVPDTASCWTAIKGNAGYESLWKLLQQPQFAAQVDEVQRQLKDVESGLGFGLDPDSLSKVVSALDVFIEPGKTPGEVNGALVLKVADRGRLDKLVMLIEKAAERALTPDDKASTGSKESVPTTTSVVTRRDRNGLIVTEFNLGGAQPVFSASQDDLFIVANSEAVVLGALQRVKTPGKGFGARSDYEAVSAKIGAEGHIYVYADQQAAFSAAGPVPEPMERAQAMMRQMFPLGLSGTAVTFSPAAVSYRSCTRLTGEGSAGWVSLGSKFPANKPMGIVAYAPADTCLVAAASLLDARGILSGVRTLAENFGVVDLDAQLAAAEKTLGFSITKDLVPALGNEVALIVNSIRMSGGIPQVDAALAVSVADDQRMKTVLLALEKALEAQLASSPFVKAANPDGRKSMSLKTMTDGPLTIRYAELPFGPGFTPCYAFDENYLLLATSTDSLKRLISVKSSGSGIPASDAVRALAPRISTSAHMFQYMNLGQVVDAALGLAETSGANLGEAKALVSGLKVLDTAVSSGSVGEDGIVSEGIITLKR
ncbi:MAG: hypothetical protein N2111_03650 [Candidatus Sumerlaeaceae bacterium]|nr:hypothetical protein [Candidatus Sumerlaeaceae bacterium]